MKRFAPICNPKPNVVRTRHAGCMVWGAIKVNQVAGKIHVAAKTGLFDREGHQIYDREIMSLYTTSHRIHQ